LSNKDRISELRADEASGGPAAQVWSFVVKQESTPTKRTAQDPLGHIGAAAVRNYGPQTARAVANFPISGISVAGLSLDIYPLAQVKIAAAKASSDDSVAHCCSSLHSHLCGGIQAKQERCESHLRNSAAFATELVTSIGYEAATNLVKAPWASRHHFKSLLRSSAY